jgi:hypothetical protein
MARSVALAESECRVKTITGDELGALYALCSTDKMVAFEVMLVALPESGWFQPEKQL